MKAIILAAGYATRLYPLTLNMPKALLEVNDKTILDYICDEIETIEDVNEIVIVTNDRFIVHFDNFATTRNSSLPIHVLNDGTTSDEDKLGAIGDISFILDELSIDEDILVIAGDNLIDFSLKDFHRFYASENCDCVCVHALDDMEELKRMGIALLDENNLVIDFEEKPANPKSNTAVTACYIYKRETLPLFSHYLKLGLNKDAPGNFPAWLYKEKPVYAYTLKGNCYDIGTPEAYEEVQNIFKNKYSSVSIF